ncbi:MAG: polyribonucleotide nucleotidyltransferase, partial [Planctomycetota bacterium]
MTTKKARSDSSTKQKTNEKRTTKKNDGRPANDKAGRKGGSSKIHVTTLDGGAVRVEREIGGRVLALETGRMAKQADGSVVARYGDTMILATAQSAQAREDIDFFPLTVDYREKYSAGGRFPGGFFKREGRPTTREILTCRIIDRSIRPLFPDGFRNETQVLSQVLSSDLEVESDVLAAVGSFAAVAVSSIPHERHLGCVRIGLVGDKLLVNPTWSVIKSGECKLNLTVAGHEDAVVMVEAGADEISEAVMLEALDLGHQVCREIVEMVDELVKHAGKEKMEYQTPVRNEDLDRAIGDRFGDALMKSAVTPGSKSDRSTAKKAIVTEAQEAFPPPAELTEKEAKAHEKYVSKVCKEFQDKGERESILKGKRSDGRDSKTIRPITVEVGVLPKVHGSVLFTRGETQALCICTLGTTDDAQMRDGIYPEDPQAFMLHYAFPPFSVGEVRRFLAPGRREVGHGALAERAIGRLLPVTTEFPYTIRVTSEILESNGSSSMASVCGGTMALMDADVPIRQPVAGIAMGLVMDGKKVAILSDILGSEDHCGDM